MSGLCLLLSWRDAQGARPRPPSTSAAKHARSPEAHDSARKGLPRVLKSMGRAGFRQPRGVPVRAWRVVLVGVVRAGCDAAQVAPRG